jgi:hypothetical protein
MPIRGRQAGWATVELEIRCVVGDADCRTLAAYSMLVLAAPVLDWIRTPRSKPAQAVFQTQQPGWRGITCFEPCPGGKGFGITKVVKLIITAPKLAPHADG